jgi:hypothetical protein
VLKPMSIIGVFTLNLTQKLLELANRITCGDVLVFLLTLIPFAQKGQNTDSIIAISATMMH